jgi:hypothetical protein
MSRELDDAMNAIPDLTEEHIQVLIDFQIAELARYNVKGTKAAKKDQSEEDVQAALTMILGGPETKVTVKTGGFKRRF